MKQHIKFIISAYLINIFGVSCSSVNINESGVSHNGLYVIPVNMLELRLKSMHKYSSTVASMVKSLTVEQKIIFAEQILNSCDWNDIFCNWSITQYYSCGSLFKSNVVPKLIINDREIQKIINYVVSSNPSFDNSVQEDNFMLLFIMDEYLLQHSDNHKAWDLLDCFFYIEEDEIPFHSFIYDHLKRKPLNDFPRMKLLEEYKSHGFDHLYQFMLANKFSKNPEIEPGQRCTLKKLKSSN